MKKTLTVDEAATIITQDEYNGMSHGAARALCEYLEELESDMDYEIEFDPVAIRCDYTEYPSAKDAADEYGWDGEGDPQEWLADNTVVIDAEDSIVIQDF